MIHNRTICKQNDLSEQDLDILLSLSLPIEPRRYDRQDFEVMRARSLAKGRGATPAEIQRNVLRYADNT